MMLARIKALQYRIIWVLICFFADAKQGGGRSLYLWI